MKFNQSLNGGQADKDWIVVDEEVKNSKSDEYSSPNSKVSVDRHFAARLKNFRSANLLTFKNI